MKQAYATGRINQVSFYDVCRIPWVGYPVRKRAQSPTTSSAKASYDRLPYALLIQLILQRSRRCHTGVKHTSHIELLLSYSRFHFEAFSEATIHLVLGTRNRHRSLFGYHGRHLLRLTQASLLQRFPLPRYSSPIAYFNTWPLFSKSR